MIFIPSGPSCVYDAFKAFAELYALGNEVACTCKADGVYAMAAKIGEQKAILLSNIKEDTEIGMELPCGFTVYVVDYDNHLTPTAWDPNCFTLKENTVALVKNF